MVSSLTAEEFLVWADKAGWLKISEYKGVDKSGVTWVTPMGNMTTAYFKDGILTSVM